jgi:C1A family cysteine protease
MNNPLRQKRLSSRWPVWAVLVFCAVLLSSNSRAGEQAFLSPFNPDFVDFLRETTPDGMKTGITPGGTYGFIPPPVKILAPDGPLLLKAGPSVLAPERYDLRELNRVTPVKDQGPCGACWAFSAYSSLESTLMATEPPWDFSENHMKNMSGFDMGPCDGGNAQMALAYLARWDGPVAEVDDPYNPGSAHSPSGRPPRKHIQNAFIIPDRKGPSDNEDIKQAIMAFGALSTTIYQHDHFYNPATSSYCFQGFNDSNHAVAIVGWDDHYPRANFTTPPPGDGAFIVKNSWGRHWGESGFYYVSYYDSNIGTYNHLFHDAEQTTNYTSAYEYDPLGWTASLGLGGETAWFANVFTAAEDELLGAVSFYVLSPGSSYLIHIYTDVTSEPSDGSLETSQTGTIDYAGYHTIPLASPIRLVKGEKFSAAIQVTTAAGADSYLIPVEYPIPGFSSGATAEPGQSFVSSNGSNWIDLNLGSSGQDPPFKGSNVCVKAFTIALDVPPVYPNLTVVAPNQGEVLSAGTAYTLTWGAPPEAVLFNIYYSVNNGASWKRINDAKIPRAGNITAIDWAVPAPPGGNKERCKIRIVGYDTSGKKIAARENSESFAIEVVKMTSPDAIGPFKAGDPIQIEWTIHQTYKPVERVELYFSKNGGRSWTRIIPAALSESFGVGGSHSYTWMLPETRITPKDQWKVKVVLRDAHGAVRGTDVSGTPFTVVPPL